MVLGDDVADAQAAAWLEDPEGLGEHRRLVHRQVDHAVGDHHVHRGGGEGDLLDVALEELDVGRAGLGGVAARQGEHLLGHVQPVRLARGAYPPGRQQHVDAAAGAKVQHDLALAQLGDRGGVAAAEACQHGGIGQRAALVGGVQLATAAELVLVDARGATGRELGQASVALSHALTQRDLLDQAVEERLAAAAGRLGGGAAHRVPPWRSATAARRPRASRLRE